MNRRSPPDNLQAKPSPAAAGPEAQPAAQRETATPYKPVTPPAPSLPKGGGAIRGIGEKLSVAAATGDGSVQVPIAVSPGRGGFQPDLSLVYDSSAGNGPFGLGFRLSSPQITRKTDKGLPRYDDEGEPDVFVLSGAEDLVPALRGDGTLDRFEEGDDLVQRYRPRVERMFARIERRRHRISGAVHWKVVTGDNKTSIYGRAEGARIADPSAPWRVFSWLLEETRDDRGNVVTYEYKAEDLAGVSRAAPHEAHRHAGLSPSANRYLKRIRYGNTVPGDASTMLFEVVFDYGEHDPAAPTVDAVSPWPCRQDPFSTYRAGFEIRTYRLCRRVLMFHRMAELGSAPCLVRSTDLAYAEDPVLTRLVGVTHAGYLRDPATLTYTRKALPPLELEYSLPEIQTTVQSLDAASASDLAGALQGAHRWVDLDGEGLPGLLVRQADALFYKRNLGGGALGPALPLPTRSSLRGGDLQMMDLDGDGRQELVFFERPLAGYFERTEEGSWAPFQPLAIQPVIDWSDPNLQFIDLNGDGHEDVLVSRGESFTWYPSRAKGGFDAPVTLSAPRDGDRGPALVFADTTNTVFLADMSGDGLTDLVRIRNGSVCYWPNLGHGRFGARIQMGGAAWFDQPDQFDPRRIRLADVDGSGTTDVLYLHREGAQIYANQAGNSLAAPIRLPRLPDQSQLSTVAVLDLLGTGTGCLVWSSPLPGAASPLRYVDLLGGKKPYLLTSVRNNLGLETRFRYAPSTKFYLADRAAGRPWITRLPFPVHVVERVERYDHISRVRFVTEYRYHHGHYDGVEREFGGFGRVEQVDAEAFSPHLGRGLFPEVVPQNGELPQPPVLTKTWFHTGAWQKRGAISRLFEEEYHALDEDAPLLLDTILPEGLTGEEQRLACRALRGQALRQEIYTLDGSAAERRPYSVVESSFSVRREQPGRSKAPAVFFVAPREAISLYYERYVGVDGKPDPRVTHAFTLLVDERGAVRRSAQVAYARRQAPADADLAAQGQHSVSLTEIDVEHIAGSSDGYRLGIPVETRLFEVHGLTAPAGVFSFEQITALYPPPPLPPVPVIEYEDWPIEPNEPPLPSLCKRLIERVRVRYYDSANLSNPLPLGSVDVLALPYESYQLALTPGQIAETFNATETRVTSAIFTEGGYVQFPGEADWWMPSGRQIPDPARFFLPVLFVDPWGTTTTVEYDAHALLPTRTEDALGNQVTVENDYRTLSPVLVTDPNGNQTAVRLDELGMLVATAVMGKVESTDGDTLDDPTTTLEYDLFRFQTTSQPSFVRTRARESHRDPATRWQESYSYSDGSGHEFMRKVQVEPGPAPVLDENGHLVLGPDGQPLLEEANPRWVGTGRTVFDNKGNPIKQYEPYFSRTHEYEDDLDLVQWGVTPVLHYDPLGRLVRTDFPNGTCSRVEFTPWCQATWDPNDTVLDPGNLWFAARHAGATPAPSLAEQRAASLAAEHAGTPTVVELDPLGRPFLSIADLGGGKKVRTRTTLDIEGNPLVVTDARGNDAMVHTFDVAGRKIHQNSVDAGARWMLTDVVGNPLRLWDSRGYVIRTVYDVLRRPTGLWVQKDGGPEVLAEQTVYGEGHPDAAALNLQGKVWKQYDGAGLVTNEAFDFKGNLLGSSKRLATDYRNQLDWSQSPGPALEAETFTSTTAYDALNRPISITKPDQSEFRPVYNEAGLLEAVDVRLRGAAEWTAFVEDIDYDARGQRERIVYGNGVITEYSYDPLTFRLTRIKTTRPSDGVVLQDLRYTHDPVGNIVEIEDRAQCTIYYNNQIVEPVSRYEYDALYRLTRAEGREHAGQNADIQQDHLGYPLVNSPHPNDAQALRDYTELYQYDDVGNLLAMIHQAGSATVWTRRYEIAPGSNRLLSTSLPGDGEAAPYAAKYTYNKHGSMTSMPHLASIGWDFKDQQREVDLSGGGKVYFTYNAAGERVRKAWEHSGIIEERIYLGGYEVYRRREGAQAQLVLERQTLHVMDDTRRVALVETKTVDTPQPPVTPVPRVRYQIENHLGSAAMELDVAGLVISYEEYHPYGTTAYWSAATGIEVSQRRYRYTGKEKDEETGLYYHGARYYSPWLGRWTAADPAGMVDGPNLSAYVRDNPVNYTDPGGEALQKAPSRPRARAWMKAAVDRAQGKPVPPSPAPQGGQKSDGSPLAPMIGGAAEKLVITPRPPLTLVPAPTPAPAPASPPPSGGVGIGPGAAIGVGIVLVVAGVGYLVHMLNDDKPTAPAPPPGGPPSPPPPPEHAAPAAAPPLSTSEPGQKRDKPAEVPEGKLSAEPGARPTPSEEAAARFWTTQGKDAVFLRPISESGQPGRTADLEVAGVGRVDILEPKASSDATSVVRSILKKGNQASTIQIELAAKSKITQAEIERFPARIFGHPDAGKSIGRIVVRQENKVLLDASRRQ